MSSLKKIALVTGGGDCPGLNAAIRAVVQTATVEYGLQVVGVPDGFKGLNENKFVNLDIYNTNGIFAKGGTILGSSNSRRPQLPQRKSSTPRVCRGTFLEKNFAPPICIRSYGRWRHENPRSHL